MESLRRPFGELVYDVFEHVRSTNAAESTLSKRCALVRTLWVPPRQASFANLLDPPDRLSLEFFQVDRFPWDEYSVEFHLGDLQQDTIYVKTRDALVSQHFLRHVCIQVPL